MPNEINNNLNVTVSFVADLPPKSKRAKISSSTATVSIWTISGILLAACTSNRKAAPGGDGMANVQVIDGPVSGAAVYFDVDGDGVISQEDRDHEDNVDAFGNPRHVTGADGTVAVPGKFATTFFVANVDGAIDTQTGEELKGEFHSFANGRLATPIADLINDFHEMTPRADRNPETADAAVAAALMQAFGANADVTMADVQNPDNYDVLTVPVVGAMVDGVAVTQEQFDAFLEEHATQLAISRAALIITEIKEAEADGEVLEGVDYDSPTSVASAIFTTLDDNPANDIVAAALLAGRLAARIAAHDAIQSGKPLALPKGNVQINEGDVLVVGEYAGGAQALFGFTDPGGNLANDDPSDDVPSSFAGIYIDVSTVGVSFTALNDQGMRVEIAADVLGDDEVAPTDNSLRPSANYFYISASRLAELEISATARATFKGELEVSYIVFDGEAVSDTATLTIIVNDANDVPTLTFVGLSLAPGAIAAGMAIATESVDDVANPNSPATFTYSLTTTDDTAAEYAHNDLFEIDAATGVLTFTGEESDRLDNGASYNIEVTVTESAHADGTTQTATQAVDIIAGGVFVSEMASGSTGKYSSDAEGHAVLVEETTPASGVLGYLGIASATVGTTTYAIGTGDNSAEFMVAGNAADGFVLNYVGGALGDRESADGGSKIVNIIVDLDGDGAGDAQTYQYVVTLTDVNDAEDVVFSSDVTGITALVDGTMIGVDTPVYTAVAANDDFGGDITYALSGADIALFDIDVDGAVTFKTDHTVDFETKESYSFTITATSTHATTGMAANTQDVTIAVTDTNDTPTGFSLTGSVLTPGSILVGTVTPIDPDMAGGDYTYAITGGADMALFSIDANTGVLTFNNGANADEGDRKGFGATYLIEITVMDTHSDSTTLSYMETITIREGGVYLTDLSGVGESYTGHDAGLIDENADGSDGSGGDTNAISIGLLEIAGRGINPVTLAMPSEANDNGEFVILANSATNQYALRYMGNDFGDFEADGGRASKIVQVVINSVTYDYQIFVRDIDDNDPVFSGDFTGDVVEDAPTTTASGTVTIADDDGTVANQDLVIVEAGTTVQGTYGSISFTGNAWTYTIDNARAATQAISDDLEVLDTFTVTAGATDQVITITITGVNDVPIITAVNGVGTDAISVSEDMTVEQGAAVSLTLTDVDTADSTTRGDAGFLSFNVGVDSTIIATDAAAAAASSALPASTLNAGGESITTLDFSGANVEHVIKGTYGWFNIKYDAVGELEIRYAIFSAGYVETDEEVAASIGEFSRAQSLDAGEVAYDVLSIIATDGSDANSEVAVFTAEITGANDAPTVILVDGSGDLEMTQVVTVTENAEGVNVDDVRFRASDLDITDSDSINVNGFSIHAGGARNVAGDVITDLEVQALFEVYLIPDSGTGADSIFGIRLIAGQFLDYETIRTLTLGIQYNDGDVDSAQVTGITINVDDLVDLEPSFTSLTTGTIIEDTEAAMGSTIYTATATAEGEEITFSLDNPTSGDAALFDIDGTTGAVTWKAATTPDLEGSSPKEDYSFTVRATIMAENAESVLVPFSSTRDVVISVASVDNSAPAIGGDVTGAFTAGGSATVSGTLTVTGDIDAQTGASLAAGHYSTIIDEAGTEVEGTYGTITYTANSNAWSYEQGATAGQMAAIAALGDGIDGTDTFTVRAGATTQDIVITATGIDEAPVLTIVAGTGTVAENSMANIPTINNRIADVDSNSAPFTDGVFTIVSTTDGFSSPELNEKIEAFIASNGNVGYRLKSGQSFDSEVRAQYTFDVYFTDGGGTQSNTISYTFNVANVVEAPTITSSATPAILENQLFATTDAVHTVAATAPASGQTATFAITGGTDASLFTIDAATGMITFVSETRPDFEVDQDGYNIEVTASAGGEDTVQTITIAITPVDEDVPTITGTIAGAVDADGTTTVASGTLILSTDSDHSTSPSGHVTTTITEAGTTVAGKYGSIVFTGNAWTYTLDTTDADTQTIADDVVVTDETFTVTSQGADGQETATITISITGSNTAPTINVATGTGAVNENAEGAVVSGISFTAADVNPNDQNYQADQFEIFTETSGVLDSAVRALFEVYLVSGSADSSVFGIKLKAGQTLDHEDVNSYSISLSYDDGDTDSARSSNLRIIVTNVDEAPEFTSLTTGSVTDGTLAGDVYTAISTTASGQTIAYELAGGGDSNLFNIHATTGVVTFKTPTTPDADAGPNQISYTFTIIARAGGEMARHVVTITVDPVDQHQPTIGGVIVGSVTEDSAATAGGTLTVTGDADSVASGHRTTTITETGSMVGTYGTIVYAGNAWVYTLDSSNGAVQALDVNEELFDEFIVNAGSASETITITVNGDNDASVVTVSDAAGTIAEDAAGGTDVGVLFAASDVDTSDQPITVGGFDLDSTTSGVNTSALNALFEVYSIGDNFGIRLKSGASLDFETTEVYRLEVSYNANSVSNTVDITINVGDVAEGPVFSSGATGTALAENTEVVTGTTVYEAVASAAGAGITYTLEGTDALLFDVSAQGLVTFKAATTPNYETKPSYAFTVVAAANGGTANRAVTIAVTDNNDAPEIIEGTAAGTIQDGAQATNISDITFQVSDEDDNGEAGSPTLGDFVITSTDTAAISVSDLQAAIEVYSITDGTNFDNDVFGVRTKAGQSLAEGTYTFTVTYTDGTVASAQSETFTIMVSPPPLFDTSGTPLNGNAGTNTVEGTVAAEIIQGGDNHDTINSGGGGDVIIGGHGADIINLLADDEGADTIIYRFDSDGDRDGLAPQGLWRAIDGDNTINNFRVGVDRLILVDVSTDENPINDFAEFIADGNKPVIVTTPALTIGNIVIAWGLIGSVDGTPEGEAAGNQITIHFDPVNLISYVDNAVSFQGDTLTSYQFLETIFGGAEFFTVVVEDDLPAGFDIL